MLRSRFVKLAQHPYFDLPAPATKRRVSSVLIAVAAAALALAPGASAGPPDQITPVVASVLASPEPVLATDARKHLVYELILTNRGAASVTVRGSRC